MTAKDQDVQVLLRADPNESDRPPTRRSVSFGSALAVALLSGLLSLASAGLALRLRLADMELPWGRGTQFTGDSAYHYLLADTMKAFGWFTFNPDVGFPWGMDIAHIPQAELHQWATLKAITALAGSPVVALNAFFLFGFFATGFCSALLFTATVRSRSLAVLLSVVGATLPWHFSRFHHTLLADYSAVPILLLLAFTMWRGVWVDSWGRFAAGVAGAVYVGSGGAYYAFFAVLVLAPVLLGQVLTKRRLSQWWRDAVVVLTIPATLWLSLMAHRSLAVQPQVGRALESRDPMMSLGFAGDVISLFTPWPIADIRYEADAGPSFLASAAVVTTIWLLVALAFQSGRGGAEGFWGSIGAELQPWFRLFVWVLLWFLPGLGWVFSTVVSPEIRSWGRLSVVLLYISLVIAGIALRTWVRMRSGGHPWGPIAAWAVMGTALAGQLAVDHRPLVIPDTAVRLDSSAREYVGRVDAALPDGCPVLQLPAMSFPEDWRSEKMAAYDHAWVQIYDQSRPWSFGAVNGTPGGEVVRRYYLGRPLGQQIEQGRADGFCAVHVDTYGMEQDSLSDLSKLLGAPTVAVGRWVLFAI